MKEIDRLNDIIKDTQWKIDNIDEYMISEIRDVISKIGTPRESVVFKHKSDIVD